jgi:hypothetical protein
VVLEAEAREHEVQALPAEAADRVAVAWGVPEAVAAGAAAAVEVVAEQGNKSGLFGLDRCAQTLVKVFVSFRFLCARLRVSPENIRLMMEIISSRGKYGFK